MTAGPPSVTGVRIRRAHVSQVRAFVWRSSPLTNF